MLQQPCLLEAVPKAIMLSVVSFKPPNAETQHMLLLWRHVLWAEGTQGPTWKRLIDATLRLRSCVLIAMNTILNQLLLSR